MADSVGEPEDQNAYVHATLACLPVGLGLGFCPWYVAIAISDTLKSPKGEFDLAQKPAIAGVIPWSASGPNLGHFVS